MATLNLVGRMAHGKHEGYRNIDKKLVEGEHACYILITCGHPSSDGKMKVECIYDGDPDLAAYLLQNAQGFIQDE